MSSEKRKLLIIGATGKYGKALYDDLVKDHEIWVMQKSAVKGIDPDHWLDSDLKEPADSIRAVQQIMNQKVILNAVLVCSRSFDLIDEDTLHAMHVTDAILVKALEPLLMVKHLLNWGGLDWTGRAVFLKDTREVSKKEIPYGIANAVQGPMGEFLKKHMPITFDVIEIEVPDITRQGAIEEATKQVREALGG